MVIVQNQKPKDVGYGNINLQLISTNAGLQCAKKLGITYCIKTRPDCRVHKSDIMPFLEGLINTFPVTTNNRIKNRIVGGKPIISKTISLRTVESEIAESLTNIQNKNKDVEIGSYPFFQAGKLGVSIVIRSEDQSKIDSCNSQILIFVNEKK